MITTKRTMAEFIREYRIGMTVKRVGKNPYMEDMGKEARHWLCCIWLRDGEHGPFMEIHFSQGSAHVKPPRVSEVLECLADDSASVENAGSFEEWANDLGFEPDSRKAERSYNACVKQAEDMKRLLGPAVYEELLWQTERD